jgi:hypothetical protein
MLDVLDGLLANIFAIGPKVQTRPRKMDFLGLQKSVTRLPGEEVKLSTQCRNILRHVKEPYQYNRDSS